MFVTVYLDDILIYSRKKEEHVGYIQKVFAKLRSYNLFIDPEKYFFYIEQGQFLENIITTKGIEISSTKVQAIKE
jgi:hypothetical protein